MSSEIKELIDRLRTDSLDATKASLSIMDLCMEAASALEDLDAQLDVLVRADVMAQTLRRKTGKRVLDVACGSKMFWFDRNHPDVEFCDNRTVERHEYYPHRYMEVTPDTVCDFTALPFADGSYKLVVFDPPHLTRAGATSWMAKKYGCLQGNWRDMLRKGFDECFRVLDQDGVLIFKWSEVQVPLREILSLSPYPPLFGHRSGKSMNTHWICFMRPKREIDNDHT